jgi:hypothetical protein
MGAAAIPVALVASSAILGGMGANAQNKAANKQIAFQQTEAERQRQWIEEQNAKAIAEQERNRAMNIAQGNYTTGQFRNYQNKLNFV